MEALAAELLVRGRHRAGNSMRELAAALGHVIVERRFRARVRGFCVPGTIFLSPSGYRPRDEFTIAHELLEQHLPRHISGTVPEDVKEKLCDRGAAALLLPASEFLNVAIVADASLPTLRRRFPLASYETIASRLVDLLPTVTASCWKQGSRAWWRGPLRHTTNPEHLEAERRALRVSHRRGHGEYRSGVRARAWRLTARGARVALTLVEPG